MIATLSGERDRMTGGIDVLVRNRDAIGAYLDAVLEYGRTRSVAASGPGATA